MAAPDTYPWGQHLENSTRNMFLLNGSFTHRSLPSRLSLLYCRYYFVQLLFASAVQKILKFPESSCCVKLACLHMCYSLCLEYPSSFPLLNLTKSDLPFKLSSWATFFRKISCPGSEAHLSASPMPVLSIPPYKTLADSTRTGGFPVSLPL